MHKQKTMYKALIRPILFSFDPEKVHHFTFSLIKNLSKISYKTIFSTNFGRELEYYTGMVFSIKDQSNTNLIQGGRYDNLLSNLGAKRKIPAVGAAINLNFYDN